MTAKEKAPSVISSPEVIVQKTKELLESVFAEDIAAFVRGNSNPRFVADNTLEKRIVLHEAIRRFLETGKTTDAVEAIEEGLDRENATLDVVNDVQHSEIFDLLRQKLLDELSFRYVFANVSYTQEIVGRTALLHLVDCLQKADTSHPLDICSGKDVTVCYIPGSSGKESYMDVATTSWLGHSNSLSIYPDRTFINFLQVLGVSKRDWLDAVERNETLTMVSQMETYLAEREQKWSEIADWEVNGDLEVDVEDVVAAVDACRYGFTPMIAFSMNADDVLAMDFAETLEVTGGIIGLHDFKTGSGDPLRFEGTIRFAPKVGDLHMTDDRPMGLIAVHGFLSSSFKSNVARVAHFNREMRSGTQSFSI